MQRATLRQSCINHGRHRISFKHGQMPVSTITCCCYFSSLDAVFLLFTGMVRDPEFLMILLMSRHHI